MNGGTPMILQHKCKQNLQCSHALFFKLMQRIKLKNESANNYNREAN